MALTVGTSSKIKFYLYIITAMITQSRFKFCERKCGIQEYNFFFPVVDFFPPPNTRDKLSMGRWYLETHEGIPRT